MKSIQIHFLLLVLISCTTKQKEESLKLPNNEVCPLTSSNHTPELLWSTKGFDAPESITYDSANSKIEAYYVSNVVGSPVEKDAKGWISKVSTNGEIIEKKYFSGLNAPKGVLAAKGLLYVTDIDRVVCYSIDSRKKLCETNIPGAKFLNDVSHIYGSAVIFSDTFTNKLSVIEYATGNAKIINWLESPLLESPNGLTNSADSLLIASWGPDIQNDFSTTKLGKILEVSLKTRKVEDWGALRLGHLDGIAADGKDAVLVSDWVAGKVYRLKKNGECRTLLEGLKGAADFTFIASTRTLLIPLMQENKVNAYKLPEYN